MCTGVKKLLTSVLILAIMVLPFRMAFSMPVDNSGDGSGQHCRSMAMVDMTSSSGMSPDVDGKAVVKADCCSSGDSDCSGCAHITAVYFGLLQFSDVSGNDVFSEIPLSFITQIISPPSRPPLLLYI